MIGRYIYYYQQCKNPNCWHHIKIINLIPSELIFFIEESKLAICDTNSRRVFTTLGFFLFLLTFYWIWNVLRV